MNKLKKLSSILLGFLGAFFFFSLFFLCFVFQGSLEYKSGFLFPFTFLPIATFTFLSVYFIFRFFKLSKKLIWPFLFSLMAIILSYQFQINKIAPYFPDFQFQNKDFSKFSPLKTESTFSKRLLVSSLEGAKLLPLSKVDQEILKYLEKILKDGLFYLHLKDFIVNQGAKNLCELSLQQQKSYGQCFIDLQKEFINDPTLSAEGNLLLSAAVFLGVYKAKDLEFKELAPQRKRQLLLQYYVDMLELSLNSSKKAQETILLTGNNLTDLLSEQMEFKHLLISSTTFEKLSKEALKEAQALSDKKQLKRLQVLNNELKKIQIDEIKKLFLGRQRTTQLILNQIEKESLLLALGNRLDENLSSKIIGFLSHSP